MRKLEWKKKNRQRFHITDRQGYTLVELIVTFALLAIFMTAVVACLPKITKIYTNLQAINHQKTICNTVSNQIRNELQSTLGVEGTDDALGVKVGNGIGYIALIDASGQQIMIPTGGAVATGGAILPDTDLTGETIEFVFRDGIIAQLDTKGFNGYTMRKNKLQVDYHDANAISSGALLTRYYQTDGDYNKKLTAINYNSTDYAVSSEAGIVADGPKNVAFAIDYPYASPFYEGYELKTKFTIKKDAFYSYGDGTTASPARTYVNYINYTLSLWKDGHMTYSQDYVVNVQNAVPYLGTKAAVDPVVPDVPGMSGTYVVPGSMHKVPGTDKYTYQYGFVFHIERSMDENGADTWVVHFPENLNVVAAWIPNEHSSQYDTSYSENTLTIKRKTGFGFMADDDEFIVYYQIDRRLEDLAVIDGSDYITCISTPYATPQNSDIIELNYTRWENNDSVVDCKLKAKSQEVKVYIEVTYEKEIASASLTNPYGNFVEFDGKTVRVYGYRQPPDSTYEMHLKVQLVGGTKTEDPVSITFGNVPYEKP